MQEQLAYPSSNSTRVVAKGSDHFAPEPSPNSRLTLTKKPTNTIRGLFVLLLPGNFSDLPSVESQSYALRVERPSLPEILGLVICIVIVVAGLLALLFSVR